MKLNKRGYTLIEVLAAAALVALASGAAASLASSLGLQEEFARRVAVTRNYQENMAQLWQLGLNPAEVSALMPSFASGSPLINRALRESIFETPRLIEGDLVSVGGITVRTARCRASVNVARNPGLQEEGAPFEMFLCRPSIGMRTTP
jgi:prepilin-type N-terminal cleavage/methylation domain-containing protein